MLLSPCSSMVCVQTSSVIVNYCHCFLNLPNFMLHCLHQCWGRNRPYILQQLYHFRLYMFMIFRMWFHNRNKMLTAVVGDLPTVENCTCIGMFCISCLQMCMFSFCCMFEPAC